jgi:uncharacterized membrane protein YeaQ/YmgE (transglycosylase-associated protein family)
MTLFNGTLTLEGLIVLIVIAAMCGVVGSALAGRGRAGLVASMTIGVIGGLVGPWVAREFHVAEPLLFSVSGQPFPVLWSIAGATLLVAGLRLTAGWRWART